VTGCAVKGLFARPVLSVAGAVVAAGGVAVVEATKVAREWEAPIGALVLADAAVLVPVATL